MKYRKLKGNEIIKEGDEWWFNETTNAKWVKCYFTIGCKVLNICLKVRRPIKPRKEE